MGFAASLWGGPNTNMDWLDGMTGCTGHCDISNASVTFSNFAIRTIKNKTNRLLLDLAAGDVVPAGETEPSTTPDAATEVDTKANKKAKKDVKRLAKLKKETSKEEGKLEQTQKEEKTEE